MGRQRLAPKLAMLPGFVFAGLASERDGKEPFRQQIGFRQKRGLVVSVQVLVGRQYARRRIGV